MEPQPQDLTAKQGEDPQDKVGDDKKDDDAVEAKKDAD